MTQFKPCAGCYTDAECRKATHCFASPPVSDASREALIEAERFMQYFAGETDGLFVGPGTPKTCLAQIRAALSASSGSGR